MVYDYLLSSFIQHVIKVSLFGEEMSVEQKAQKVHNFIISESA